MTVLAAAIAPLLVFGQPSTTEPPPPVETAWVEYVAQEYSEPLAPVCAPLGDESAACYATLVSDMVIAGLGTFADDVWTFETHVYEPVESASPYPTEDELRGVVEEWREANRPDLEFDPMLEVAVTYCTDETEPMILAALIDGGDIAGNLLEFLKGVCPDVIAAASAAL